MGIERLRTACGATGAASHAGGNVPSVGRWSLREETRLHCLRNALHADPPCMPPPCLVCDDRWGRRYAACAALIGGKVCGSRACCRRRCCSAKHCAWRHRCRKSCHLPQLLVNAAEVPCLGTAVAGFVVAGIEANLVDEEVPKTCEALLVELGEVLSDDVVPVILWAKELSIEGHTSGLPLALPPDLIP